MAKHDAKTALYVQASGRLRFAEHACVLRQGLLRKDAYMDRTPQRKLRRILVWEPIRFSDRAREIR